VIIKWSARIIATAILLFGLPFYFGYGNPLPFINPDYTHWDNLWLSIFPIMFFGLVLGWKFEKIGGLLVTLPLLFGFIFGFIITGELTLHMLAPFCAGLLYLVSDYVNKK